LTAVRDFLIGLPHLIAPNGKRIGHCSDSERRGFAELRKSARLYACVEGFANIAVTPSEGQYSVRQTKFGALSTLKFL
jgi:hypothetical protein